MNDRQTHVVTGAFGFSGKYITRRLLERGRRVVTITNSPERPNPFGGRVTARPFDFDRPDRLTETLRRADVLYNTYWVRFNHRSFKHEDAVQNTLTLFRCAREAGVRRLVHVSITNPAEDSPFEYFRGKARLEAALAASGLSYAILRPAVLFGPEDILINNIAWTLRRFPLFGLFGRGRYRLQPIFVDDLAELAVSQGEAGENSIIEAIGPETFAYRDLVRTIGRLIGKNRPIVPLPPILGYLAGLAVGRLKGDVFVTWEEIGGLMADLLYVDAPPAGKTLLTDWIRENAGKIGRRYASELKRRRDRKSDY